MTEKNDLTGVRYKNFLRKKNMIKHLYYNKRMTKSELASITNTTPPTITKLLEELMDNELVEEKGVREANSRGGPRPAVYGLRPNSRYIVSVYINMYNTRIVIFNLNNEMVTELVKIPIKLEKGIEVVDRIAEELNKLIDREKIDSDKILGCGVAIKGLIDSEKGVSYTYLVPDKDITTRKLFEQKFGFPTVIENDARVLAMGEYQFGKARKVNNVLCLNVEWGVGMGIITDGILYRGKNGLAGEIGHIQLDKEGSLCECGMRGCLETIASGTALKRELIKGLEKGIPTKLKEFSNIKDPAVFDLDRVFEIAQAGDHFAINLVSQMGYHLGKGIAILLHLFNPEMIIIGGTFSKGGNYILDSINRSLNEHVMPKIRIQTKLVTSDLGKMAIVKGGVALFTRWLFKNLVEENIDLFSIE